ncbi:MAG: dihydrofolate reductase [Anaerovoracaceae bacterium]
MNAIVVVDQDWGIGREGKLLVHLPGDLNYFKEKTLGKTIVMGRKTLDSLPGGKPLPGRTNIVLTGNQGFCNQACTVCYSFEELVAKLEIYPKEEVFISGGEAVYRQFMPYVDTIYVTKIEKSFSADRFFENLDEHEAFQLTWQDEPREENGVRYRFAKYERK